MPLFRRHRYEVPGVQPHTYSDGWASYTGDRLADRPAVVAALARSPRRFLPIVFEPQNPDLALSHADLLSFLEVTTRDGVSWGLGVADEVKDIIDTGMDVSDEDLVQQALAGQPDVVEAAHPDREDYRIHLARPLPADEVLARVIDAIAAAHRKLARHLRIDIPE